MPPKKVKRQRVAEQDGVSDERTTSSSMSVVSSENPSNMEKGLLKFPVELREEVLHHFQEVNIYTKTPSDNPILPVKYLEWTDALRVLSQVSVAYRRVFLPRLWETFTVCIDSNSGEKVQFFAHAGKTLTRKCDGLSNNPELAEHVRHAHVVLTRYKSATIIPKFASLLTSLPNLHTLHVLHAHTLISKALKEGFADIRLPQIRNLIIPGYCHELLKCCPGARSIWCIRDDGQKLITVIATNCKEVEELRGFQPTDNLMKRIVKGVPNLRVYEILDGDEDVFLKCIGSFKKFDTIILRPRVALVPEATIKKCSAALKGLPPTTNKHMFISHEYFCETGRRNQGASRQLTGDLTKVDLSFV